MARVCPPVIELRQYALAPGRRERMIELFERYFAAAQMQAGMPVLGLFQVPTHPDALVWIRGFADLDSRPACLSAFYGGAVWAQFGLEAIGCVERFNNVQLLRETSSGSGIAVDPSAPHVRDTSRLPGPIAVTTYRLKMPPDASLLRLFEEQVQLMGQGRLLGCYVSDPTPNNFPSLPIREGEQLLTWFARGGSTSDLQSNVAESALASYFAGAPERLVLQPTTSSFLF